MNLIRQLAVLLLLAGAGVAPAAPPASAPLPRDSVYQLPLALVDQHGRKADWRDRRGKPQLVSMFYTSCQYMCPLIVESGKAVQKQLPPAERDRLDILLISMDPKRDTPSALAAIATQRKLDGRWTLASPPANDVRQVAGVLGVRYRALADGEFNHSSALLLLDGDGRILARTEKLGALPDPEFVTAVRRATRR